MDSFSSELYIENLRTLEEVNIVVKNLKLFNSDDDRRTAMATLAKSGIEAKLSISIKSDPHAAQELVGIAQFRSGLEVRTLSQIGCAVWEWIKRFWRGK